MKPGDDVFLGLGTYAFGRFEDTMLEVWGDVLGPRIMRLGGHRLKVNFE